MHDLLACLSLTQRHFQGLRHLLGLQAGMDVPAHDLAGMRIGDQAEVDHLVGRGQVRDVGHPQLLAARDANLRRPRFDQVGVTAKAMMAVRCLVVRPAIRHKQARVAQHVEHRITPQLDALALQRLAQQVVQFARAQSGLAHPLLPDQPHHRFGAFMVSGRPVLALVVRLAADAHVMASPGHAQPLNEAVREDLPEGFFTTRTP